MHIKNHLTVLTATILIVMFSGCVFDYSYVRVSNVSIDVNESTVFFDNMSFKLCEEIDNDTAKNIEACELVHISVNKKVPCAKILGCLEEKSSDDQCSLPPCHPLTELPLVLYTHP